MPHAFSQSGHPFGKCKQFSQVEPFEKPWFVVVHKNTHMVKLGGELNFNSI
jgi:hypothetical protein